MKASADRPRRGSRFSGAAFLHVLEEEELDLTQPLLLDLFCGAGGASRGYADAGFDIVGVDINPQPRYPFTFIQGDALEYLAVHGQEFVAIHASPPCQRYSAAAAIHNSSDKHPALIEPTREALIDLGKPWVIENVQRAPLRSPITLCGSMFGLGVRRHRLFESSFSLPQLPCGSHADWYASVFGKRCVGRQRCTGAVTGSGKRTQTWEKFDNELAVASRAMGIDWMNLREMGESIPPAYTQWIGERLKAVLSGGGR
jgi:DNA (cytosine-5)-methyltransferase 1